MSSNPREFDVVLFGATGFTGRLVAAYLLERHGVAGDLRWAIAGRNADKLAAVASELASETGVATEQLERCVVDAGDASALQSLAARTTVVCTTVGPYARYGSELVAACAGEGTHYCDLTGELPWMRRMIDAHEAEARRTGARIVHNCGFDSIPSDMGAYFMQREMRNRFGVTSPHVKARVAGFSGGFSGGTAASLIGVLEEATSDPGVRRLMGDPFSLNPEGVRPADHATGHGDLTGASWDPDFSSWTAPFVMAAINTRVVRRSAALLPADYGGDFHYDESMLVGSGATGWLRGVGTAAGTALTAVVGALAPTRRLLARVLPKPGEGPSREAREAGYFEIRFFAEHPTRPGDSLFGRVRGDRDPGYGSTSKMLGEAAVSLASNVRDLPGGFYTPAAAMGDDLLERLQKNAGVSFEIDTSAQPGA